jgi:hypothetical protein
VPLDWRNGGRASEAASITLPMSQCGLPLLGHATLTVLASATESPGVADRVAASLGRVRSAHSFPARSFLQPPGSALLGGWQQRLLQDSARSAQKQAGRAGAGAEAHGADGEACAPAEPEEALAKKVTDLAKVAHSAGLLPLGHVVPPLPSGVEACLTTDRKARARVMAAALSHALATEGAEGGLIDAGRVHGSFPRCDGVFPAATCQSASVLCLSAGAEPRFALPTEILAVKGFPSESINLAVHSPACAARLALRAPPAPWLAVALMLAAGEQAPVA